MTRKLCGINYVVVTPSVYVMQRIPQISITFDGSRWNIVSPNLTRQHPSLDSASKEMRRAVEQAKAEMVLR